MAGKFHAGGEGLLAADDEGERLGLVRHNLVRRDGAAEFVDRRVFHIAVRGDAHGDIPRSISKLATIERASAPERASMVHRAGEFALNFRFEFRRKRQRLFRKRRADAFGHVGERRRGAVTQGDCQHVSDSGLPAAAASHTL